MKFRICAPFLPFLSIFLCIAIHEYSVLFVIYPLEISIFLIIFLTNSISFCSCLLVKHMIFVMEATTYIIAVLYIYIQCSRLNSPNEFHSFVISVIYYCFKILNNFTFFCSSCILIFSLFFLSYSSDWSPLVVLMKTFSVPWLTTTLPAYAINWADFDVMFPIASLPLDYTHSTAKFCSILDIYPFISRVLLYSFMCNHSCFKPLCRHFYWS